MITNKQKELWSGVFGDQYQDRNILTPEEITKRKEFWQRITQLIYMNSSAIPSSVLEIGAGQGPNLTAIKEVYMQIEKPIDLYATEVNEKAQKLLKINIPDAKILPNINSEGIADLVFTYGVMIHTHPAHLKALMRDMYKASKRWIVCCEYFAPTTRAIPYRGEEDALWLDDYGGQWLDNHPLRVLGHGFCWKRMTGLDNVTFWILEKTN